MAENKEHEVIVIKSPKLETMKVPIIGITPYVPHAQDMEIVKSAQHIGSQVKTRKQRDLDAEYESCFYRDKDGDYVIPGSAFHSAICSATIDLDGIHKTTIKRNVHILEKYAKLEYDSIQRREDIVRQSGKTRAPDLRVRPEFVGWKTVITVTYDANIITKESVLNLISMAGFKIGVGDHRLEQGHDSGAFEIGETNVKN